MTWTGGQVSYSILFFCDVLAIVDLPPYCILSGQLWTLAPISTWSFTWFGSEFDHATRTFQRSRLSFEWQLRCLIRLPLFGVQVPMPTVNIAEFPVLQLFPHPWCYLEFWLPRSIRMIPPAWLPSQLALTQPLGGFSHLTRLFLQAFPPCALGSFLAALNSLHAFQISHDGHANRFFHSHRAPSSAPSRSTKLPSESKWPSFRQ